MKNQDNQLKKRAVICARYSTGPNQTNKSIEGQIIECTQFAKK